MCVWASDYIHSVTSLHALEFPYVSVVTPAIHHNCSQGKTAVLASGIFTAHQPIKLHLILFQSSPRLQREVQNGLWRSLRGNSGAELLLSSAQCDSSGAAAFLGRWKSVGVRGSQWHLRILDGIKFSLCLFVCMYEKETEERRSTKVWDIISASVWEAWKR